MRKGRIFMMKNKIILLFLVLFIPSVIAFSECSDTNLISISSIPCNAISDYIIGCPDHYNYTVYSVDNSYYVQNGTMTFLNDNMYNFTLWNVTIGTYNIWLCDNSTATVSIVQGSEMRYFYIFVLITIFLLFIIGMWKRDNVLLILSGMGICSFAIYSYVNGLIDLNNSLMEQAFLMVLLGIGFYLIGLSSYKLSMEGW
jgi:hypothetical protein